MPRPVKHAISRGARCGRTRGTPARRELEVRDADVEMRVVAVRDERETPHFARPRLSGLETSAERLAWWVRPIDVFGGPRDVLQRVFVRVRSFVTYAATSKVIATRVAVLAHTTRRLSSVMRAAVHTSSINPAQPSLDDMCRSGYPEALQPFGAFWVFARSPGVRFTPCGAVGVAATWSMILP